VSPPPKPLYRRRPVFVTDKLFSSKVKLPSWSRAKQVYGPRRHTNRSPTHVLLSLQPRETLTPAPLLRWQAGARWLASWGGVVWEKRVAGGGGGEGGGGSDRGEGVGDGGGGLLRPRLRASSARVGSRTRVRLAHAPSSEGEISFSSRSSFRKREAGRRRDVTFPSVSSPLAHPRLSRRHLPLSGSALPRVLFQRGREERERGDDGGKGGVRRRRRI